VNNLEQHSKAPCESFQLGITATMLPNITRGSKIIVISLVLSLTVLYFSSQNSDEIRRSYHKYKVGEKEIFVEAALKTSVDSPFDDTGIRLLCADTKWQEGIIVSCNPPLGGVVNVQNVVLNCVRYAILAGGWLRSLPLSQEYLLIYPSDS